MSYLESKESYVRLLAGDGTAITNTSGTLDVTDGNVLTMDMLLNGYKSPVFSESRILGSSSLSGVRFMQPAPINMTTYTRTASNVKVRLTGTDAADTFSVYIEGVDTNGDLVTQTVALNGTGNVDTTAAFIHVNRVYAVDPANCPAGNVSVILDYANNGFLSGTLTLGYYETNGQYGTTLLVCPNGHKMIVRYVIVTNYTSTGTAFRYGIVKNKGWIDGATQYPYINVVQLPTGSTQNVDLCLGNGQVYNPGEMFGVDVYTAASGVIPVINYQVMIYVS